MFVENFVQRGPHFQTQSHHLVLLYICLYIYIYTYIYVCVCIYVCIYMNHLAFLEFIDIFYLVFGIVIVFCS